MFLRPVSSSSSRRAASATLFVHLQEAAGQCPLAFEGGEAALDEHDFQVRIGIVKGEDDQVDGEGGAGVVVGVGHLEVRGSKFEVRSEGNEIAGG